MSEPLRRLDMLEILGGNPAVDFVNTVNSWRNPAPADYLHDYAELVEWNRKVGLIGRGDAEDLLATPAAQQQQAFRRALVLRGQLHDILQAVATGKRLKAGELGELNRIMAETAEWRDLQPSKECCSLGWDFQGAPADAVLGPVAWEAIALLTGGKLDRLKECPGENCGWLFIDASKNRSRHWCSMKTCGNTAKVKRFRQRKA